MKPATIVSKIIQIASCTKSGNAADSPETHKIRRHFLRRNVASIPRPNIIIFNRVWSIKILHQSEIEF